MNPEIEAVPVLVVNDIVPDEPASITAKAVVGDIDEKLDAGAPPKFTAVIPLRFVPVIVITVPLPAFCGVMEVIVGTCAKALTDIKLEMTIKKK